eukprot:g9179.t1
MSIELECDGRQDRILEAQRSSNFLALLGEIRPPTIERSSAAAARRGLLPWRLELCRVLSTLQGTTMMCVLPSLRDMYIVEGRYGLLLFVLAIEDDKRSMILPQASALKEHLKVEEFLSELPRFTVQEERLSREGQEGLRLLGVGVYCAREINIAIEVDALRFHGGALEVIAWVTGTEDEGLLRWTTGSPGIPLRSMERSQDLFSGDPPVVRVLREELQLLRSLATLVRKDLMRLRDMLVAKIDFMGEMEEVLQCIRANAVPSRWQKRSFPSCRPLSVWLIGLKIRAQWLEAAWGQRGHEPLCYRLDLFWRPRLLLLSHLRVAAQKLGRTDGGSTLVPV